MKKTSKEIVLDTLEFKNVERAPRDLWLLPWAGINYPTKLEQILSDFPEDIIEMELTCCEPSPVAYGDQHEIGESVDAWGCKFVNLKRGIIGEVKEPIVRGDEWEDTTAVHIPYEKLNFKIEDFNKDRESKGLNDKFVIMGSPRPFEQLQFMRGTENLYMDLVYQPTKMFEFIEKMHAFNCEYLEKIAKTNVDGLFFLDDWGSQKSLLINPAMWREIFKPMYRDFISIAKKHGKKAFMHSDGYILDIIPDLIDLGLDALNCQIFCMGVDKLKQFKGKITFWVKLIANTFFRLEMKKIQEKPFVRFMKIYMQTVDVLLNANLVRAQNPKTFALYLMNGII